MRSENLLLVADSEHDANMLYAVRMFVPDPFIFLRVKGRSIVVMNDLEIDRARRVAPHCRVVSLSACQQKLRRAGVASPTLSEVIRLLARTHRLKKLQVPQSFPHGLARELRRLKLRVKVRSGAFFPERECKSPDEVKKISAALMMAEVGLAEGIQALRNARIGRRGQLMHHQVPLTSEKLRAIIDIAILQAGGLASHTIVAGGEHGCDPHEVGHGPLRANQPILIDIFPRSQQTGYFGDISRTVVRGRASDAVRGMYHAVETAQQRAFKSLRPNTPAAAVHRGVQESLAAAGFRTGKVRGRMQGFFHGTGHGLGLEIHEAPRLNGQSEDTLRPGHVVTIEPGLYYSGIGGVRLEDVALVTATGYRTLSRFEKALEI